MMSMKINTVLGILPLGMQERHENFSDQNNQGDAGSKTT